MTESGRSRFSIFIPQVLHLAESYPLAVSYTSLQTQSRIQIYSSTASSRTQKRMGLNAYKGWLP